MKYDIRSTQGDVLGHIELAEGLEVVAQSTAPAAPPAPPQMQEVKTMTEAAGAFTYEQYQQMGWSDNALLANGLMKIEMHSPEAAPGGLHPSVANQPLGEQWQPEQIPEPPKAPAAPAVPPIPDLTEAPRAPGVPTPPPVPAAPAAPSAPAAPGVPTPPPASEPNEGAAANLPDGLREVEAVPHVAGREFMVKGRSFEKVVDRDHVPFDGRIHGLAKDNLPATKQDGTFKKKRGVANEEYERILAELTGDTAPQAAPTPPPAPGAPSVPNVPQAPAAPQTAPPQPDNMDALQDALKDWGEEI